METLRKHPRILIAAALGLIVLVVVLTLTRSKPQTNKPGQIVNPQEATNFYSPFTKTSDTFLINYTGSVNPNINAARQQFRIMALNNLPMPADIKQVLPVILPQELAKIAIPTYAPAFIQINRDTLKCSSVYDCQFSFYIDSPESYFDFHLHHQSNGTRVIDLKQQPLPGTSQ